MAVLCLTLGIGANAAVLSWIEGILFRPYPGVAAQDRLVAVAGTSREPRATTTCRGRTSRSRTCFPALLLVHRGQDHRRDGHGRRPRRRLSDNWCRRTSSMRWVCGPLLGRGFTADEETGAGAHPVTVISYRSGGIASPATPTHRQTMRLQQHPAHDHRRRAARDSSARSSATRCSSGCRRRSSRVQPRRLYARRSRARWIEGMARFAPGVSLAQAQTAMSVVAKRLEMRISRRGPRTRCSRAPALGAPFDNAEALLPTLRVAFVVVVLRAAHRLRQRRQPAARALVRAPPRDDGSPGDRRGPRSAGAAAVTEGVAPRRPRDGRAARRRLLVPACAGAVLCAARRRCLSFAVSLDWRVLGVSAAVGLTSTLVFALVPAMRSSNIDLAGALKADSAVIGGRWRSAAALGSGHAPGLDELRAARRRRTVDHESRANAIGRPGFRRERSPRRPW